MNQDQVRKLLQKLDPTVPDFTVIFTGKRSKKVDGLYKPETREILLHSENFESEEQLIYTAIHEFAHHIHFTRSPVPISSRSHTTEYWNIFHNLLFDAEKKGLYKNIFRTDRRFVALTKEIKEKYLIAHGELIKEFGALLLKAHELCREAHASFEDYMDRELGLYRPSAKAMMKISAKDVNTKLGPDNMRLVASIRDEETARGAEEALLGGETHDMVKFQFKSKPKAGDPLKRLLEEKDRIERSLERLESRLAEITAKIDEIKSKA
jgi:hypothetical protein